MNTALLLAVLGYWATDHEDFNRQVLRDGRPFEFTRSNARVISVNDYLERVLYVSGGLKAKVRGVPFKQAATFLTSHSSPASAVATPSGQRIGQSARFCTYMARVTRGTARVQAS